MKNRFLISDSEKSRILSLHESRKDFRGSSSLLNEQVGPMHNPPVFLNLINQDNNINFDEGTTEETRRIDIENRDGELSTEQLMELSRFPNLEVLHIDGGTIQSLPAEAISPNLLFLSLPGAHIGSLPVEEIVNSNINVLNIRNTKNSVNPDDIMYMQENGIDVIT